MRISRAVVLCVVLLLLGSVCFVSGKPRGKPARQQPPRSPPAQAEVDDAELEDVLDDQEPPLPAQPDDTPEADADMEDLGGGSASGDGQDTNTASAERETQQQQDDNGVQDGAAAAAAADGVPRVSQYASPAMLDAAANTPPATPLDPVSERIFQAADVLHKVVYNDEDLSTWPSLTASEAERFNADRKYELVYGEIKLRSMERLLKLVDAQPGERFFDIGSGDGKVLMAAYLLGNFSKVAGIEYVPSRFERACLMQEVWQELGSATRAAKLAKELKTLEESSAAQTKEVSQRIDTLQEQLRVHALAKHKMASGNELEAMWGDATKLGSFDADVVYTCNTCFGQELMRSIMDKFAYLHSGTRIISLTELPADHPTFKELELITRVDLPMTWTSSTGVNIYRKITDPPLEPSMPNSLPSSSKHNFPKCTFTVNTTGEGVVTLNFDPATYNTEESAPPKDKPPAAQTDKDGNDDNTGDDVNPAVTTPEKQPDDSTVAPSFVESQPETKTVTVHKCGYAGFRDLMIFACGVVLGVFAPALTRNYHFQWPVKRRSA